MSLTTFLKKPEVRALFKRVKKPKKPTTTAMCIAKPQTKNYSGVGTAFDYLMRFYIERNNPHIDIMADDWVARAGLNNLNHLNYDLYEKALLRYNFAQHAYQEYIRNGELTNDLFEGCMILSKLDPIYRARYIPESFDVDSGDIQDLKNLVCTIPSNMFFAKKNISLNPTFGIASHLIGGADADFIIDNAIIDIKTTKKTGITKEYFNQIWGYYILSVIEGRPFLGDMKIGECKDINRIGIYSSRFGELTIYNISEIMDFDSVISFATDFTEILYEMKS